MFSQLFSQEMKQRTTSVEEEVCGWNSGPLEEQYVLLNDEQFLQSKKSVLLSRWCNNGRQIRLFKV